MFKNYFKTAWRNLVKNRFYSAINISGLAIGLAVGIMLLLWVEDELSFDRFHSRADDIYRINSHLGTGSSAQVWEGSPAPLAVFCKQSIPEVVNSVRILNREDQVLFTYRDKKFLEKKSAYIDPSFFSVFDFKLLKGNKAKPFKDNNSIILTSSVAKKYFGSEDAIGKVLIADGKNNFTVSGIVADFPENSSMQYDMLYPMSLFAKNFGGNGPWKTIDEDLGDYFYQIYLQVQKGASAEAIGKKITKLYRDKRPDEPGVKNDFFQLQSLKTKHLIAADGNDSAMRTVKIFLLVAVLILFIACINYVNLSTARSMVRSKEVSVRKIIGAARLQLFIQFIMESALLFLFASALAFALIYFLLPLYNNLTGKHLVFDLSNKAVWLVLTGAIVGTLSLAGIYPALLLSSFKPVQALRGKLSLGIGNSSFRKILVITQFTFSVGLIIATIVISSQLKYIKEKDLGYNREYVFSFWIRSELHDHLDAARDELLKQPGVLGVSTSNNDVIGVGGTTGDTDWEGKESGRTFLIHPNGIDKNFIPLLKMQMAAGNNFTGSKSDSAHVILNETAVRQAGIKDPIGKTFTLWQTRGTIIGVVKDFNYVSLKYAIEPTVFYYGPENWLMYIKTTGKDAPKAIAAAQKIWKTYVPDFPFEYSFLDDEFDKIYHAEQRTGVLFNVFSIVAIVISCLGLFGLSTYSAQVKTKEIGIRKVLGASVNSIANLLAKEFIVLVLFALLIATPIAWWLMNKWLQNYAYRINISWWIFLATALLAIVIALITVSFQAIKAALANPVKSLRTE